MPRAALGVAARVNVSVLYQFVDTANRPWPTNVAPAAGLLLGRAARGSVSRKMACRPAAGNSRTGRGSLVAAPSNWGNGRQDAQPCFARRPVALLRRHCLDYGSRCFRLGLFCVRCSWDFRRSREALALTPATQKGKSPAFRSEAGLQVQTGTFAEGPGGWVDLRTQNSAPLSITSKPTTVCSIPDSLISLFCNAPRCHWRKRVAGPYLRFANVFQSVLA